MILLPGDRWKQRARKAVHIINPKKRSANKRAQSWRLIGGICISFSFISYYSLNLHYYSMHIRLLFWFLNHNVWINTHIFVWTCEFLAFILFNYWTHTIFTHEKISDTKMLMVDESDFMRSLEFIMIQKKLYNGLCVIQFPKWEWSERANEKIQQEIFTCIFQLDLNLLMLLKIPYILC